MRPYLIEKLVCPNSRLPAMECAALEGSDDIVRGVLFCRDSESAFPIVDSIPILLSDDDTNVDRHRQFLLQMKDDCPSDVQRIIDTSIERLTTRQTSDHGLWNREEMDYFDGLAVSPEKRRQSLQNIRNRPDWNIYIPRETYLLRNLEEPRSVLEVGCGGARTIAWSMRLDGYSFQFVGIDIAFNNLLVAKSANEEGDFMQASALNLPFKDESFDAVLAFGSLHHLPSPVDGLAEAIRCSSVQVGLHEPIDTPKLLAEGSGLRNVAGRIMGDHEHSDHDAEISVEATIQELQNRGCSLMVMKESVSIAKPFMKKACDLIGHNAVRKAAYRLMFFLDDVVVQTLCRISRRFGPRAVIMLARKQ